MCSKICKMIYDIQPVSIISLFFIGIIFFVIGVYCSYHNENTNIVCNSQTGSANITFIIIGSVIFTILFIVVIVQCHYCYGTIIINFKKYIKMENTNDEPQIISQI